MLGKRCRQQRLCQSRILERLSQVFLLTLTFWPSMIFMTFSVVKDRSKSNLTQPTFCDIRLRCTGEVSQIQGDVIKMDFTVFRTRHCLQRGGVTSVMVPGTCQ